MIPVHADALGLRCFVYARTPGPGRDGRQPWLLGVLPGGGLELPSERLAGDTAPADAALRAVARLTGRAPRLVIPPVPPLGQPGAAEPVFPPPWWIRAPHSGPYETEYEYVMTLPGAPPAGLAWMELAVARARAHAEDDENLHLGTALGTVLEPLLEGKITPSVIRAMTLGHSRRDVGRPRSSAAAPW
ncbi:hypothetical protein J7E91_10555 [Streptomyces sp. ISL-99]|uniref:hypothetical protein n=1 Tax=Streptomyces sp. ISL-99 TaxID=2819193 RepID=UPI001BE7BA5F|nr:hypothetical protein [Streptomyces sp. ISL-99]MBT2525867.1 hypothetical protein [Streptomyces sp. ISL-99]